MSEFVSRAGFKLEHALAAFAIRVAQKTCADLGCSTGGFVDCLLQNGATKVYAVDTGYGVLDWKLRNDPRVIVMERKNAMHVLLPEPVDIVTIDVSWTRQQNILPAARKLLAPGAMVIALIKPHYEADKSLLRKGVLPEESVDAVVDEVKQKVEKYGFNWLQATRSPIKGTGGNTEVLALLKPLETK
ncbi:MAG: TlyA family RNA methyltransferase [Planctomycetota bacterium]|nr:TlyA family RNA methyltransferase [Planctomycetota bacterium]